MKDKMTSFDLAALIPELNRTIKGARIDNIYQINPKTLLFKLRKPNQSPFQLVIEAGKRIHLTSYVLKKPRKPSSFCMSLRKHLRNSRILDLQQHEFERVSIIEMSGREGTFQLVTELFGEGNVILVNPQNKILQALTYRKMRDRKVLRGECFKLPPSSGRNPLTLSRKDFYELRNLGQLEIVRGLTRFLSIGGLYAEEILLRAGIKKNALCGSLTEEEMNKLFDQLQQIVQAIKLGKIEPRAILLKNEWIDVVPISLREYADHQQEVLGSFVEALDEFYLRTITKQRDLTVDEEKNKRVEKQKRILRSQLRALETIAETIQKNRNIADMIFAHLGELQLLLQRILDEKRRGKTWEFIISNIEEEKKLGQLPASFFHSLKPNHFLLKVLVEDSILPLDFRLSVQANAGMYYKKAKKAEGKLKGIKDALQVTQNKIKEYEEMWVREEKKKREHPPKRRIRKWFEKFRWFYSSEGFLVIGGRDATTNEIIIKKHMETQDAVFHADVPGAPFVLIKTQGRNPSERTQRESAEFAASYSRAWKLGSGAVDVYWVSPHQISKSAPQGQFIKKGSFIIRGSKNYIRKVPLRVSIGAKLQEQSLLIVGGPVGAISKQTEVYVEIVPGKQTSGKLAKQIQHLLSEKLGGSVRNQVLKVPPDEIQRFIPPGRGDIVARAIEHS